MELTARYGLEFDPFLKNSKDILFLGKEYKEAVFRLDYLSATKGFGLLTGAPGRGKTTLVRSWSATLNPSLFKVVYSCLSTLTVMDFYRSLAASLGAKPAYRKSENFNIIQSEISHLFLDKRKTPIIIIDEAHYINTAILGDLKLIFNFQMDSRDRAVLLLVGLPQLINTLSLSIHEPLRQRIIMNYDLDGLSKDEACRYIDQKLRGAGCSQTVFEPPAIDAIVNAADGTPRVINKLCHTALVIGHARGLNLISADVAMQAINDCTIG